jgi:uncharacterized membrane protein
MSVKLVDNYFSDTLKWTVVIGSALLSGYLVYAAHHQWIIFFLLLISLISFSTKYLLEIDTEKKRIIDSFYFLWIRTKSEEFKFNTLNCIRLDKQRHVYNATSRSMDRQADFYEYIATIEFDQNKSLELERKMEYQSLAEVMNRTAAQLNIPIQRTF